MEVEKIINLKFSIALTVNEHGGKFNLIIFFVLWENLTNLKVWHPILTHCVMWLLCSCKVRFVRPDGSRYSRVSRLGRLKSYCRPVAAWSPWQAWMGSRTRHRDCHGRGCPGDLTQTRNCYTRHCNLLRVYCKVTGSSDCCDSSSYTPRTDYFCACACACAHREWGVLQGLND